MAGDLLGLLGEVGRPDGFMRLLRVLGLGLVFARGGRHLAVAVKLGDETAGGRVAALRLALDVRYQEASAFERRFQALGGRLIGDIELLELLAVGGDEPRPEALVLRT